MKNRVPDPGGGDFAAFFEQYKNLVYRTAYLQLGNEQDAEDTLQEVFTKVYHALDRYDPSKGAVTTWLYRITINHCLSVQRRKQPVLLDVENQVLADHRPPPDHSVEADDTLNHLLGDLSDKLRAVVILRYTWDLSYVEIADILDIPLGTVQSRLNAAVNQLRQNMALEEEV